MPTSAIPGAPDSTSAQQQCQTLQEIAHRHIAAMPVSRKFLLNGIACEHKSSLNQLFRHILAFMRVESCQ